MPSQSKPASKEANQARRANLLTFAAAAKNIAPKKTSASKASPDSKGKGHHVLPVLRWRNHSGSQVLPNLWRSGEFVFAGAYCCCRLPCSCWPADLFGLTACRRIHSGHGADGKVSHYRADRPRRNGRGLSGRRSQTGLFLARILVGNTLAATVLTCILVGAVITRTEQSFLSAIPILLLVIPFPFFYFRFGLLAFSAASFFMSMLLSFPISLQRSAWYSWIGLTGLAIVLAFALCAFRISLGAQPVFGRAALED
jgi:hypothetical protein